VIHAASPSEYTISTSTPLASLYVLVGPSLVSFAAVGLPKVVATATSVLSAMAKTSTIVRAGVQERAEVPEVPRPYFELEQVDPLYLTMFPDPPPSI